MSSAWSSSDGPTPVTDPVCSLQWHTKGWHPHQPTLGGMLVFELHSTKDSRITNVQRVRVLEEQLQEDESVGYGATSNDKDFFVKAYFVTASPQQMRNAEALSESNVRPFSAAQTPFVSQTLIPCCVVASRPCTGRHSSLLRRNHAR